MASSDPVWKTLVPTFLYTIVEATKSRKIGDGKIFVTNIKQCIHTGEKGEEAIG